MPRPDEIIDSLPPFSTNHRRSLSNTLPDSNRYPAAPTPARTITSTAQAQPEAPDIIQTLQDDAITQAALPTPTPIICPPPPLAPSRASSNQTNKTTNAVKTLYSSAKRTFSKLISPVSPSSVASRRPHSRRRRHSESELRTPGLAILALTSSFFVLASLIMFIWVSAMAANIVAIVYTASIFMSSAVVVTRYIFKKMKLKKKGTTGTRETGSERRHQHRMVGLNMDDAAIADRVRINRSREVEAEAAMDPDLPPYSPRREGDDIV